MAIALNHLGSHGSGDQSQALTNALFDVRAEMRSIADRAGNFAHRHLCGCIAKALLVALILRVPIGDFQTKGDGLGVHAVRSPNLWGGTKFLGAFGERVANLY